MDSPSLSSYHKREFEVPMRPVPVANEVAIITVCAVCLLVSWIAVLLRLWTRAFISRALGTDDWVIAATVILFSVFCGIEIPLTILVVNKGTFDAGLLTKSTALLMATEIFYCVTMISLKISLGIFFLRIMVEPWQKRCTYAIVTVSTLSGVVSALFSLFFCGLPVSPTLYWQRGIEHRCASYTTNLGINYEFAVVQASTDLLLVLISIPIIVQANIGRREKWIIAGIFTLAGTGIAASLTRIHWIATIAVTGEDFWFEIEWLAIWSTIEPGMGIIAASLATMRPLLRRVFRTNLTTSSAFNGNLRCEKSSCSNRTSRANRNIPLSIIHPDSTRTNRGRISPTRDGLNASIDSSAHQPKISLRRFSGFRFDFVEEQHSWPLRHETLGPSIESNHNNSSKPLAYHTAAAVSGDLEEENRLISPRATWFPISRNSILPPKTGGAFAV